MLNLLVAYARDHDLVSEPGFKPKEVLWSIAWAEDGRFLDIVPLAEETSGRKRSGKKTGRIFPRCPDLSQPEMKAEGAGCRHFLVDTAEVVTLYGDRPEDTKLIAKHAYFVDLLRQASTAIPVLVRIADSLCNPAILQQIHERLRGAKAKPNDNVTIAVPDRDPPHIVDDPSWHDWWRSFRQQINRKREKKRNKGEGQHMRCLASGELVIPLATHPKIEGLFDVGGQPAGDALISFKQDAFCSYGLAQSANAAVSEEMAYAYRAALSHLLKTTSQTLAGAKVVYWYVGEKDISADEDPIRLVGGYDLTFAGQNTNPDEEEANARERARKLLKSIHTGERRDLAQYKYYALTLSGAAGRVMVRDWMQGQFAYLVESINQWFSDLEITNLNGTQTANPPKIERVITCLLPEKKPSQDYRDWIKPVGSDRIALWRSAVRKDYPIPASSFRKAILQHSKFIQTGQLEEALDNEARFPTLISLMYARLALMKAFLIRNRGDKNMSHSLNKNHPEPAYHCGRLLYVLARLQHEVMPDVKAGVVQRYYGAASSTPALVLGRLIRNSKNHLNALSREQEKLARQFENELSEILSAIDGHTQDIPRVLSLEDQSLFALGYYHQMAYRPE